jgi:hypothetical protein
LIDGSTPIYTFIPGLTLNLLTTTIVAPPSNASKWQMGINSAFKGLKDEMDNLLCVHFVRKIKRSGIHGV